MVILPCLRGEQNVALSLAWSPWRGTPRTYIQSYRSRFPGARAASSRSRIFDKSRATKLRSRHLTPKFRRKAITGDHDDDGALSEEDLRWYNSVHTYITQFNIVTNDTTTMHRAGQYYFRPRRRNRILVDDAYGRALLCYDCAVTVLPVTYRVGELLRV